MKRNTGVLIATILGSSMVFLDSTVVNVILPRLQSAFGVSAAQILWLVEAYLLFLSSLILLGGALGDRYGRKQLFQVGTVVFVLASAGCGVSRTLTELTLARSIQGVGGALLTPGSLAIINGTFPKAERGRAVGTWSAFSAATSALGPVIGGWLSDHASWRWVFFLNLPIGLVALYFIGRFVPEQCGESRKSRPDFFGAVTSVLGLGAITLALIEASDLGFRHPYVLWTLAIGIVMLILFVRAEARVAEPLMPLTLFRSRSFVGANLCTLFLYGALGAAFYFLPFNLVQVHGFTATQTGAANLPFIILVFLLSRFSGGLYDRFGPRFPLALGSAIVGVGFLLLGTLSGLKAGYWKGFFPGLFVFGLGMSLCISPLTSTVLGSVPVRNSGLSSGFNNAVARLSSLIAIPLLTVLVLICFESQLKTRLQHVAIPPRDKKVILRNAGHLAAIHVGRRAEGIVKQSYLESFREVMEVCCALSMASAFCALVFLRSWGPELRLQD